MSEIKKQKMVLQLSTKAYGTLQSVLKKILQVMNLQKKIYMIL